MIKWIPGTALGISTACFILGLLIVNLRLAAYGVYSLEFVRTEYILVGAVFLFLVVTAYVSFAYSLQEFKSAKLSWKERKYKRAIAGAFFGLVVAIGPVFSAFSVVANNMRLKFYEEIFALTLLILIGFMVHMAYVRLSMLIPLIGANTSDKFPNLIESVRVVLVYVVMLLVFVGGYALIMYPQISPAFGGGNKSHVVLIPTQRGLEVSKLLTLPVSKEQTVVGPLEVLSESEHELIIVAPGEIYEKRRAIRLNRELFDAIQAVTEKEQIPLAGSGSK